MKLSIITINYNNLAGLQKTMQTVLEQSFTGYEYIIIDGGSTDGSKTYIEQHAGQLAYWASEKDGGIYDAMNKGIAVAKGELLMFLNSGDYLLQSNVLQNAVELINTNPADIYYADNVQVNDAGETYVRTYDPVLTLDFWKKDTINHQSSFIKRELFNEFGLYNTAYSIAADYAFYVKAFVHAKTFFYIKQKFVYYGNDGISSTNRDRYILQAKEIWKHTVPALTEKLHEENKLHESLMQQKIMAIALKLNKTYQSFRRSLK